MPVFASLPKNIREYRLDRSRSAINWRAQVTIDNGLIVKNFYSRTEEGAVGKAEDWIEENWPGSTGRHGEPPYDDSC